VISRADAFLGFLWATAAGLGLVFCLFVLIYTGGYFHGVEGCDAAALKQ
jgi:hypothetical protein